MNTKSGQRLVYWGFISSHFDHFDYYVLPTQYLSRLKKVLSNSIHAIIGNILLEMTVVFQTF